MNKVLFLLSFLFIGFGCQKNNQQAVNYNLAEQKIDKLLTRYEKGEISRNQFLNTVANGTDTASTDLQAVTIDHVTMRVKDLERSAKFYEDVFGMKIKRIIPNETYYLSVGNSFFAVESLKDSVKIDHFCLGLKNFNTEKLLAKLKSKGVKIEGEPGENSIRFRDPDGIIVQLSKTDYALSQARQQ
jgi:glyoxylase I family protein